MTLILNIQNHIEKIYNLEDALKRGELYEQDVPKSSGAKYPEYKKQILDLVPPKGYWRDLPVDLQKDYMGGSFYLGGGKNRNGSQNWLG